MELTNKETIENYSLEGVDLKGEVQVKNGIITKCVVHFGPQNFGSEVDFTEQEIRDLHKEFGSLLSIIDKQKGVGNV